jgi:hypothetical protein
MKTYADIIVESILGEAIVYQDRILNPGDNRKTVICLAPTKAEWNARYPQGAAGVLMKDGQIVIGDGCCLAHDVICDHAGLDIHNEAYRLQMSRTHCYGEIWMTDGDYEGMSDDDIRLAVQEQYGEPLEAMTAKIAAAVQRFMGPVQVRAIPLGEDQKPLMADDVAFVDACWAR